MEEKKKSRGETFVEYVLARKAKDTGFAARMRRADNPDTEYQSWGTLAALGVNLERDRERIPSALIGAALCQSNLERDGDGGLGTVLAACLADESGEETKPVDSAGGKQKEKPGDARMRRVLACSSTAELCRTLRPLLKLINRKTSDKGGKNALSHARLLTDLLYFESRDQENMEKIKKRWAMEFYGAPGGEESPFVGTDGKAAPKTERTDEIPV